MARFQDLPDEVMDIIFSYIPRNRLREISSIPNIGLFSNKYLYSVVVIDPEVKYNRPTETFVDDNVPVVISPRELLIIIQAYGVCLKRIRFEDPFDAFIIADHSPQYLERAKVDLAFGKMIKSDCGKQKRNEFIERLTLYSFVVNSLTGISFARMSENMPSWNLVKNITEYSTTDLPAWIRKLSIENLRSLILDEPKNIDQFFDFPGQLKELTCTLGTISVNNRTFQLPPMLEKINFTYLLDQNDSSDFVIDISTLKMLYSFKFSSSTYLGPRWILPKSVKLLDLTWYDSLDGHWQDMVPNLENLTLQNITTPLKPISFGRHPNEFIMPKNLYPKTKLKYLNITERFLNIKIKAKITDNLLNQVSLRTKLSLPETLEKLVVNGNGSTRIGKIILDFKNNNLKKIKEIEIIGIRKLCIHGNIPRSLKKVTIDTKLFCNWHVFSFLPNLTNLSLSKVKSFWNPTLNFLESVCSLSLINCNCETASISAPRLRSLTLTGNKFNNLDDETLIIPKSPKELDLSNNEITKIEINLPPKLQVLILRNNRLKVIKDIPKNIKYLDCSNNQLGYDIQNSSFPTRISKLDLSGNKIDAWIKLINLVACTRLRLLSLSRNKFTVLDTTVLPDCLVDLDLSHNLIGNLPNLFKKFKYLKSLNLQNNNLNIYFEKSKQSKDPIFGVNIRTIDVRENHLTTLLVGTLIDEVAKKRKFERLDVEEELILPSVDKSTYRPRKIREL